MVIAGVWPSPDLPPLSHGLRQKNNDEDAVDEMPEPEEFQQGQIEDAADDNEGEPGDQKSVCARAGFGQQPREGETAERRIERIDPDP